MNKIDLKVLSRALPIHAEEGPYREIIKESVMIEVLSGSRTGDYAAPAIEIVRRLFQGLRLLDEPELLCGNWAFISFPAYLMGRSVVEMLAHDGSGWFEPGYWNQTGSVSDTVVEQQRGLLTEIERRRIHFHPEKNAAPIRIVWVAWGIIRLGNDFLLVHREDKDRDQDYVFPGGRFNLEDIPPKSRTEGTLRMLYVEDRDIAPEYLHNTLSREINEELCLQPELDYKADRLHALAPYRKIEGSKNNLAYTDYRIVTYSVKLTTGGESRLFDNISASEEFEWFTADDLMAIRGRVDGKCAFIDALRNEFPDTLRCFLNDVPDSGGTRYRSTSETEAIDLPASCAAPFRVGKTGKEKDVSVKLSSDELAILRVLVAHNRRLELEGDPTHLKLLGGGWIKLLSSESEKCAVSLARNLAAAKLPIVQVTSNSCFRLTIDTQFIYFAEASFTYSLKNYELSVETTPPAEPWASIRAIHRNLQLDPTVTLAIRSILKDGRLWKSDKMLEGKDFDRELREKLDKRLRDIGLRKLIRTDREDYVIAVPSIVET